jgi:colicin import membrane protein
MYSKRAVVLSVALHGLLIVLLTASVDFLPDKLVKPAETRPIVQARVIDQGAVAKEVERLKSMDDAKRREQEQAAKALEQKRRAEEQQVKELEARKERLKREQEVATKARAEAEQKAEAARKQAAEAERKAAEAKKKAESEAKAKAAAEAKARAEAEAKKKAEAEARKKAEAEAEAKAKAEAERKRIEQALQDELAAEEAAAQAAADTSEINRYVAAIANRVRQSFTILPGLEGLSCTLRITLVPGGEVAGVQILKSSGNPTFDRQAENAVRKAAPLPVPSDPRLFQQMRSIAFVFDPQT